MKFSIVFLLTLTLWIALGTQIYRAYFRKTECFQQQSIAELKTGALRQEMKFWKQTKIDQSVDQLQENLKQLNKIDRELVRAFEPEVPALSVVTPHSDKVSVRSIPVFKQPSVFCRKVKIYVPASRDISIKAELQPFDGEVENVSPSISYVDIEHDNPAVTKLSTGMHTMEWRFTHDKTIACFVTLVDGNEVNRFTWSGTDINGWSSQSPNWPQQKDFSAKRDLPQLGEVRLGDDQVVLQLVDSK